MRDRAAPKSHTAIIISALFLLVSSQPWVFAAGRESATYRVKSDVFTRASSHLAIGSQSHQALASVRQVTAPGPRLASSTFTLSPGYPAGTDGYDTDYDGVPDNRDTDSDNDGTPDSSDSRPYDTDNDGANNLDDDDDDNDGLLDNLESGFGTSRVMSDTDGDTQSDYAEWIAGTSGTDQNDFFGITDVQHEGPGFLTIEWQTAAGRSYDVCVTNALLPEGGTWRTIWTTNTDVSVIIRYETPLSEQHRFYRLNVSKQ